MRKSNFFYSLPRREIILYPGAFSDIRKNLFFLRKHHKKYVDVFERKFAQYIGVKYALSVGSGRIGLVTILRVLNLKDKDEVILSAYNFPQLIVLIASLGLKPILVDIDKGTLGMNIKDLEKKITKKTRVIIVTHFFGQVANIEEINNVAKRYGIFLIEDCAHSCGAEYNFKKVGSIGDANFFSFSLTKNINTFLGGMITTNNRSLFMEMRKRVSKYKELSNFLLMKESIKGIIAKFLLNRKVYSFTVWPLIYLTNLFSPELDFLRIRRYLRFKGKEISDGDFKLSDLQAFIGLRQLEFLDIVNQKRVEKVEKLKSLLKPSIKSQEILPNTKPIYLFLLLIAKNREKAIKKLISKGIDVDMGFMRNCAFLINEKGHYPFSEWMESNSFLIRLRHSIPIQDICRIADILNNALS